MGLSGKRGKLRDLADVLWLLPTRAVSGACTHTGGLLHTHFFRRRTRFTPSALRKRVLCLAAGPLTRGQDSAVQMEFPPAGGAILSKLNARCETGFLLCASRL